MTVESLLNRALNLEFLSIEEGKKFLIDKEYQNKYLILINIGVNFFLLLLFNKKLSPRRISKINWIKKRNIYPKTKRNPIIKETSRCQNYYKR